MIFNSIHYFDLIWFLIWFLQGPCKGDDGGPLYINGKTNNEGDIEGQTLAAINSGAAGKCGKGEYPAWWTRVILIYLIIMELIFPSLKLTLFSDFKLLSMDYVHTKECSKWSEPCFGSKKMWIICAQSLWRTASFKVLNFAD